MTCAVTRENVTEEAAKLMKIADDMRKDLGDNLTRVKGTGRREPGKLK